jgi:surface protein
MARMFKTSDFNGDLSKWDVSNVEDMYEMFEQTNFNNDISNWNIKNLKDARDMFYGCPIKEEYKPKFKKQ